MKLNHFVCPTCSHDFYDSAAYSTCDSCQTMFYACQSKQVTPRQPGLTVHFGNGNVMRVPSWRQGQ